MDRAKIANDCYEAGYNCAQAVACAFADVVGLPVEQLAKGSAIVDTECIQCAACADACPKGVLKLRVGRLR